MMLGRSIRPLAEVVGWLAALALLEILIRALLQLLVCIRHQW